MLLIQLQQFTLALSDLLLAPLDEHFGVYHFSARLDLDIPLFAACLDNQFLLFCDGFDRLVEMHGVILFTVYLLAVTDDVLDLLPNLVLEATRVHIRAYLALGSRFLG